MSTINSSSPILGILGIKDTGMTLRFAKRLDTMLKIIREKELAPEDYIIEMLEKNKINNEHELAKRLIKDGMIEADGIDIYLTGDGKDKLDEGGYYKQTIKDKRQDVLLSIAAVCSAIAVTPIVYKIIAETIKLITNFKLH